MTVYGLEWNFALICGRHILWGTLRNRKTTRKENVLQALTGDSLSGEERTEGGVTSVINSREGCLGG